MYATENKSASIEILGSYLTAYDRENIDLEKALDATIPYFGDPNKCGRMNYKRVNSFLNWLIENKLENPKIKNQQLFSNELLNLM